MSFNTPGVYVKEINTLPSSVAGVSTAIPGFVGYTEKASSIDGTDVTNKPVRITSILEFEEIFGGPNNQDFSVVITGPSTSDYSITITPLPSPNGLEDFIFYYQMKMFFDNGGGTCYVVSVGDYSATITQTVLSAGLDELEKIDEITLINIPETIKLATGDRLVMNDDMLTHCAKMENRFALLDAAQSGTVSEDAETFRGEVGADNLKFGAVYYPRLISNTTYHYLETDIQVNQGVFGGGTVTLNDVENTTLRNHIIAELNKWKVELYPSSSMAGVYARVDSARGVWKAPANVGIRGIKAPGRLITDTEQGGLNIDSVSGKSINAVRIFEGRGLLVWGARTLDGNSNEWRYINVRRLFLYVEQSTKNASQFVVFEPNTPLTWQRVKGMIGNFLTILWRDGGLVGAKPEEAFYVKVGVGETMTTQDVLEGRMIVEIGLAASRPAEFIVLKFSHHINQE